MQTHSNDALGIVVLGGVGGGRHNFSRDMLWHIETYVSVIILLETLDQHEQGTCFKL